jgi:hypothetical protein
MPNKQFKNNKQATVWFFLMPMVALFTKELQKQGYWGLEGDLIISNK